MIRVSAPASIGNIGPGYDTLGLALRGLFDIVEAETIDSGVQIDHIEGAEGLPYDPELNTAGIAAYETLKLLGNPGGVRLRIIKGMPGGSGLGSSAASACAAAYAVNNLYGSRLTKKALVHPATIAERAVSGGFFADNTAPSLMGGAVVVAKGASLLDVTTLGSIHDLHIVLVTPDHVINTAHARSVMPQHIPMETFVRNMSNACGISAAFAKNNYRLFSKCLVDVVAEPARKSLIPGYDDVKAAALAAGADGFMISGSGPTVFAITNSEKKTKDIEGAMIQAFNINGLDCMSLITTVDPIGTTLIDSQHQGAHLAKQAMMS